MKKFFLNSLWLVLSWLLPGMALAAMLTVTPSNPAVSVPLPANPSTGYQWEVVKYDPKLMNTPSSQYQSKRSMPGAPGQSIWTFRFKPAAFEASKNTTVILQYKRPWEKTAVKKQVIVIHIQKR